MSSPSKSHSQTIPILLTVISSSLSPHRSADDTDDQSSHLQASPPNARSHQHSQPQNQQHHLQSQPEQHQLSTKRRRLLMHPSPLILPPAVTDDDIEGVSPVVELPTALPLSSSSTSTSAASVKPVRTRTGPLSSTSPAAAGTTVPSGTASMASGAAANVTGAVHNAVEASTLNKPIPPEAVVIPAPIVAPIAPTAPIYPGTAPSAPATADPTHAPKSHAIASPSTPDSPAPPAPAPTPASSPIRASAPLHVVASSPDAEIAARRRSCPPQEYQVGTPSTGTQGSLLHSCS